MEKHQVVGIDSFANYYSRSIKGANLQKLQNFPGFNFMEANLLELDLAKLLEDVDVVLHLAAQAGVRASWGANFSEYLDNNIYATQKLLEAVKSKPAIRVVYASSSSVYGQAKDFPTREDSPCQPLSPYGVSKLAAENLCWLYHVNHGVDVVSLRFFTVYGPRQRPDMAFHRFIRAMLEDEEIVVLGSGRQSRDFTFVDDIVDALKTAALADNISGKVFNLGGGVKASVNQVLAMLQEMLSVKARVKYSTVALGDVRDTYADTTLAKNFLNFAPQRTLQQGLQAEIGWIKDNLQLLQKAGPCFF